MFVCTLVAPELLGYGDVHQFFDRLELLDCEPEDWDWIDEEIAADIPFRANLEVAREALGNQSDLDIVVQPLAHREKKLLIADMDSTMITVECIDELADYAGLKPEIAAITEAAMRGELDFEGALRGRVALLAGLAEDAIDRCLAERVKIMPGARELVRTVRALGGLTILVSGGFTRFAEPVAEQIGFERVRANRLSIADGKLSGTVEGEIVGAQTKRDTLLAALAEKGWRPEAAIAIGDGANDIPMIEAAGLGVAYHAKPRTISAADAAIRHGDLTAILYAMGIPRSEWAV